MFNFKIARAALYLGIGSVVAMLLSIILGIAVESIGIINLFRSIVLPISVASIICGLLARRVKGENVEELEWQKKAKIGIILGITVLVIMAFTILVVAIIFLPGLFV